MKTAEELFREKFTPGFAAMPPRIPYYIYESMIEFAQMHVEAALKEVSKKYENKLYIKGSWAKAKWVELKDGDTYNPLDYSISTKTNKKSILTSYPLTNIK